MPANSAALVGLNEGHAHCMIVLPMLTRSLPIYTETLHQQQQ